MGFLSQPLARRRSVPVQVGDIAVGGDAPIVVQSMTNTDTADVEATVDAGRGLRPRRLGAGAHHRRPRRGRRGGAPYPRPLERRASPCR